MVVKPGVSPQTWHIPSRVGSTEHSDAVTLAWPEVLLQMHVLLLKRRNIALHGVSAEGDSGKEMASVDAQITQPIELTDGEVMCLQC